MSATATPSSLLHVEDLQAHYGKSHILRGVSFRVAQGEVVSLLGRNGSGRSTALKAIMGLRPTVESEQEGLDLSEHGEEGYIYEGKS